MDFLFFFEPVGLELDVSVSLFSGKSWCSSFKMSHNKILKFLSWNVRGLNVRNKRIAVRQSLLIEKPDLVCIQETKLENLNNRMTKEICGNRLAQVETLPAQGTKGGIIVAWDPSKFTLINTNIKRYSVSVLLSHKEDGQKFWFSGIYGPSTARGRPEFKEELTEIKPTDGTP